MKKKSFAFTVNTLEQAEKIILETEFYNIKPVIHLKNYLVRGFGTDYILNFKSILINKFGKSGFKIFVDCGFDSSIGISMATKKIDYIKLRGNLSIISKIKNITDKNRVLLNQSFNIIDCRHTKNIRLKIEKLYSRKIK